MNAIRRFASLVIAAGACTIAAGASAAEWTVNTEASTVTFDFMQQGSKYTGRFATFTAAVNFDPAKPAGGKVVGTVKVDSVNTRDTDRDLQLVEKEFFNAKEFPEAKFESQTVTATPEGFRAEGQLTLKGTTKPATLNFTFATGETSSAAAGTATLNGTIKINRFDFNVGEGWNDTGWVGDVVTVQVKLDLKR